MRAGPYDLVPFVLGTARFSADLAARSPLEKTRFLEVTDPANLAFFDLLGAGNALAYPTMAMPDWVQLDCATLPTAMFGFALARGAVSAALWARLLESHAGRHPPSRGLGDYTGLVPISEFCAAWTSEPGTVLGFSMFSLVPGLGLGVRSKALGLLCMRARRQVGVTRREGPERRAQESFGPLRVLVDRPAPHPNPDTIVYEVDVPSEAALEAIVRRGRRPRNL